MRLYRALKVYVRPHRAYYRVFLKQGGMPETSLRKTMESLYFWRFPVHARGEIYSVFDEESDFQVENSQFRQPGQKIWKKPNCLRPYFVIS